MGKKGDSSSDWCNKGCLFSDEKPMKYGVYTSKSAGCFIEKQMYKIYRYTTVKNTCFYWLSPHE